MNINKLRNRCSSVWHLCFCKIRGTIKSYEKPLNSYFAKAVMVGGFSNSCIVILGKYSFIKITSNTPGSGTIVIFYF